MQYKITTICLWLIGWYAIAYGQTTVLSSVNPKNGDGLYSTSTMVTLNTHELFAIGGYPQGDIVLKQAQALVGNEDIKLEVYAYDATKADGLGIMIYGRGKNKDGIYSWDTHYYHSSWSWRKIKSTDIKNIILANDGDASLYYIANSNTDCYIDLDLRFRCLYTKKDPLSIVIRITLKDVSADKLDKVIVPVAGEFNVAYFQSLRPTVEIKGSNFELNSLTANQTFGHVNNRFTILNPVSQLSGYQFTGLYDGNTPSPSSSYFKVKVPANGKLWVAYKQGLSLSSSTFGASTKLLSNAFKIKDKNNLETTFDVYQSTLTAGNTITFEATTDGPFIIANSSQFDVGFKQNMAMPEAKRKFYNRADFPDEVLVCAHRGIWSKLGSHNYTDNNGTSHAPDYSGIAENTLPSYHEAIYGTLYDAIDWIEFDTRRTKDGVFVCSHDDHVRRVTNFADDRDCVPLEDVNFRNKTGYDQLAAQDPVGLANSRWNYDNAVIKNLNWNMTTTNATGATFPAMKDLQVRDYLGCKVKYNAANGEIPSVSNGVFARPITLAEGIDWLKAQENQSKYSIISMDYKAGKYDLDDLFKLLLQKNMEGQFMMTMYAADYSFQEYIDEYGKDFLKQLPITPNFYEPSGSNYKNVKDGNGNTVTDKAQQLQIRFLEYLDKEQEGYFFPGVIYNPNYAGDPYLLDFSKTDDFAIRMTGKTTSGATPTGYQYRPKWYMSHYHEPFMSSIVDNNKITTPADCDPNQNLISQICVDKFWRADFDWQLNNGTNAFFSDSVYLLTTYLRAKGKKQ